MDNPTLRIKDFILRKVLKITGTVLGFGTISLLMMCKYGTIEEYEAEIHGKVTSSKSGEAISNIQISATNNYDTVRTNASGEYKIYISKGGEIIIKAIDIDGIENGEFQTSEKLYDFSSEICDIKLDPK